MLIMPQSNENDLKLRDLRVLEVMLTECSLTRAALRLDTSQPSLSKALSRLRLHFCDPLLVRDGQAMRPTPKGAEMLAPVRELLRAAGSIGKAANGPFDPASSDRKFKLIVSDVGMVLFLPALTARFAACGPKLKLEAVPLDSHDFEARLASGEADLALGAYARAPQDLRRQLLYTDGYLCVVRRGNPRKRQLGRIAEFSSAQHIVVTASETGHTAHRMAQETIEGAVAPERILLRLPSFIAAALVAAGTDGVATVPANLARSVKERLQLATFQPPVKMPPISVAQYWHARYHHDPGHRWLRQTCFGLFARSA
jgi:DNA-binding transcriptional LysR family regulator